MPPQSVKEKLLEWFFNNYSEVYGQVATLSHNKPHIRTMRLYTITDNGTLVFLSRTDSQKWNDLMCNSHACACFYSDTHGQIIVEGKVTLKTIKTNLEELFPYWQSLISPIKKIYTHQEEMPNHFGLIELYPILWETLEINTQEYVTSKRIRYLRQKDKSWTSNYLQPI